MRLFSEIWRRKVLTIAVAYWVAAWGVAQVADNVFPIWCIPDASIRYVWIAAFLGFPIAIAFSWRFELSIQGVRRTGGADEVAGSVKLGKTDYWIFGVLSMLAVAIIAWMIAELSEQTDCPPLPPPPQREPALDPFGLAVLPCRVLGNSGDIVSILAFGFHDGLLTELSKISSLRVISRTTMEKFEGSQLTMPEIGVQLGVAHIMECSFQGMGGRVRIISQLIKVPDEDHVWANSYDRTISAANMLNLQERLVETIASVLQVVVSAEETQCIRDRGTRNTDAYFAYLRGRDGLARYTTTSVARAVDFFQQALAIDPSYAEARVALASALRSVYRLTGRWPDGVDESTVRRLVGEALELNACLGPAHAELAIQLAEEDRLSARAHFERAIDQSPGEAEVFRAYAEFHHSYGDYETALEYYDKAIDLDPMTVRLYHDAALTLNMMNRPEEAISYYEKAIELDPDFATSYIMMGVAYWNNIGRLDKAMYWLRNGYGRDPTLVDTPCIIGWVYMDLGDLVEADTWFRECRRVAPDSAFSFIGLADLRHAQGRHDEERTLIDASRDKNPHPFATWESRHLRDLMYEKDYEEWLAFMRESNPALFSDELLYGSITCLEYGDAKVAFAGTGRPKQAGEMDSKINACLDSEMAGGASSTTLAMLSSVQAVQGRDEEALRMMRRAIDNGWQWLKHLILDLPGLIDLRDDPRLAEMLAEVELEASRQLERVREMEAAGDLPVLRAGAPP